MLNGPTGGAGTRRKHLPDEVAQDTAHSPLIDSHPYVRDTAHHKGFLCGFVRDNGKRCNLAESTHGQTQEPHNPTLPYRCPDCVTDGTDPCPHDQKEWLKAFHKKQEEKNA